MKQISRKYSFQDLLQVLARQSGEKKLRVSFNLSQFVQELRAQGDAYGEKQQRHRAGTAA